MSVASAQHVAAVLPDAELWFEAVDGTIFRCDAPTLQEHRRAFVAPFFVPGAPTFGSLAEALDSPGAREATYLLCYHGLGSEDGTVQRLLEARGVAFIQGYFFARPMPSAAFARWYAAGARPGAAA